MSRRKGTISSKPRPESQLTAPEVQPSDRAWLEGSCAECVFAHDDGKFAAVLCRRFPTFVVHRPGDTCGEFEQR